MDYLSKCLAVLAVLVCSTLACKPIFRMYRSEGYGEDYVENAYEYVAVQDEPDMPSKGISSRTHTCPLGLWMGYEHTSYFGSSTLFADKEGKVSKCKLQSGPDYFTSIKVVGHPDDYSASAVVTYMNKYNEWADVTYLNDTEQFVYPKFGSLIIVGSQEVEIFTESNFQGTSFCFGPNNGGFWFRSDSVAKNHLRNGTELYTNMADLATILQLTEFNSFRFGCGENFTRIYE